MRRLTPLALLATVVAAFIVAKSCLPKRDLGTKEPASMAPRLPVEAPPVKDPTPALPR